MCHERTAHCKHLLFAARQGTGQLAGTLLKARETGVDHFQRVCDLLLVLTGVRTHLEVLVNRQTGEHAAAFGHVGHAQANDLVTRGLDDLLALELDRARLCRQHTADRVQGGGLARAVGADQSDDLALIDLKRHVLERVDHAVIYV